MQRGVAWEKWRDPYGSDLEEHELPEVMREPPSMEVQDEDGEFQDATDEEMREMLGHQPMPSQFMHKIDIISTEMGMVPIMEHTNAANIFNFWTIHTNFTLGMKEYKILNRTRGVEALKILTPHRAKIAIGKAFNSPEVKARITSSLDAKPLTLTE